MSDDQYCINALLYSHALNVGPGTTGAVSGPDVAATTEERYIRTSLKRASSLGNIDFAFVTFRKPRLKFSIAFAVQMILRISSGF